MFKARSQLAVKDGHGVLFWHGLVFCLVVFVLFF